MGNHEIENHGGDMSKPFVSIIIPTYNYAHLITETLESVLNQSYTNWECIIVDDGSTDNTKQIVEAFINKHLTCSFTYIKKVNEGTSIAKNTGISLAAGKYIQFLDADDLISPDKLAIQIAVLESDDIGLVYSKSIFFTEHHLKQTIVEKYPPGFLTEQTLSLHELLSRIIKNNIITIGSPLVKKQILIEAGMFNPDLKNNEDWLLWFKVALSIRKFVYDGNGKSFASVRVHKESAMNNHSKMFNGEVVVRKQIEVELAKLDLNKETKVLRKLNSDLLALHQVRSLNAATGIKYILSSFVKNPLSEFNLLAKALRRLAARVYKSAIS